VALATKALDAVRRAHWQEMRRADEQAAKRFKGARWSLLKSAWNSCYFTRRGLFHAGEGERERRVHERRPRAS